MKPVVGVDIVDIREFQDSLNKGGEAFISRCFHETEIGNGKVEHLAGVFAAKEAVMKALSLPAGSWKDIRVEKLEDGRPVIRIEDHIQRRRVKSADVSISHSKTCAIACFIAYL